MQEKKTYVPEGNSDLERLLYAMEQLKNRNFLQIESGEFAEEAVANTYNEMLNSIVEYNNHFLMRLNDAMIRIADNSIVKKLLTHIQEQKEPIERMQEANQFLNLQLRQNEALLLEALALSKQACYAMTAMQKRLREQEEQELSSIQSFSGQLQEIDHQIRVIRGDIDTIWKASEEKNTNFESIANGLQYLTDNYNSLSQSCFGVGSQLYRISRDIDNARNDMFRHNSHPTTLDRISVFYVDHLTLTWRLYLNVVEYEHLKITQLNNRDRCKFGLWCENLSDSRIRASEEFQKAYAVHQQFHNYAIACFLAKEASDLSGALREFDMLLDTCKQFEVALHQLGEYCRSIGITEETEVWKFQG